MKRTTLILFALSSVACASTPAAPFDTLKHSNVVAYRLQNYEPPAAAAAQQGMQIPGLPPEIQQWAQQAAPALQQLLPPGLLPGLIPGANAAPTMPQAPQQAPRFHNFRILDQVAVVDTKLKEDLAEIFGSEDSFQPQHSNCLYAEMGLSFSGQPGAPPNDVLISFSCNQVQAHNFVWPHGNTGLTSDTVKELADVVSRLFPPHMAQPQYQPVSMVQL